MRQARGRVRRLAQVDADGTRQTAMAAVRPLGPSVLSVAWRIGAGACPAAKPCQNRAVPFHVVKIHRSPAPQFRVTLVMGVSLPVERLGQCSFCLPQFRGHCYPLKELINLANPNRVAVRANPGRLLHVG